MSNELCNDDISDYSPDWLFPYKENPPYAGKKFERSRYRGVESSGTTQGSTASTFSCGKPIVFVNISLAGKSVLATPLQCPLVLEF